MDYILQHDGTADFYEQTVCIPKEKKGTLYYVEVFLSFHPIAPHNSDIEYYSHITANINAHNSTVSIPILITLYLLIIII